MSAFGYLDTGEDIDVPPELEATLRRAGRKLRTRRRLTALSSIVAVLALVVGASLVTRDGTTDRVTVRPPEGLEGIEVIQVPSQAPTVRAAIEQASPGALILLAPGVYRETNVEIAEDKVDITIRGEDRNLVVFEGNGPEPPSNLRDGWEYAFYVRADRVTFENMTFRDYSGGGIQFDSVNSARVSYTTATRVSTGIFTLSSENIVLTDNATNGTVTGISVRGNATGPITIVRHRSRFDWNGFRESGGNPITIAESIFESNRQGILFANSASQYGPASGSLIVGNRFTDVGSALAVGPSAVPDNAGYRIYEFMDATAVALLGTDQATLTRNNLSGGRVGVIVGPQPASPTPAPAARTRVTENVVRNTSFADLVFLTDGALDGTCFARNTFTTSRPANIEQFAPCEGSGTAISNGINLAGFLSSSRLPERDINEIPDLTLPGMPNPLTARPSAPVAPSVDATSIETPQ